MLLRIQFIAIIRFPPVTVSITNSSCRGKPQWTLPLYRSTQTPHVSKHQPSMQRTCTNSVAVHEHYEQNRFRFATFDINFEAELWKIKRLSFQVISQLKHPSSTSYMLPTYSKRETFYVNVTKSRYTVHVHCIASINFSALSVSVINVSPSGKCRKKAFPLWANPKPSKLANMKLLCGANSKYSY